MIGMMYAKTLGLTRVLKVYTFVLLGLKKITKEMKMTDTNWNDGIANDISSALCDMFLEDLERAKNHA
jgi:hypothetical protein